MRSVHTVCVCVCVCVCAKIVRSCGSLQIVRNFHCICSGSRSKLEASHVFQNDAYGSTCGAHVMW